MTQYLDQDLTEKIIGAAFEVHNVLGPGFLEKAYQNFFVIICVHLCLSVDFSKKGVSNL